MLHAVIDIGSNTIRMAVYQIADGGFEMLMKRKHTVGLAGCLENGRLTRDGVETLVKILGGFVDLIDALGIRASMPSRRQRCAGRPTAVRCSRRSSGVQVSASA